jgi:hypothetical protein
MTPKRLRLLIGINAITIGSCVSLFSKEFFASGTTARHMAVYSGVALILSGLVLVLLHLKAEKKL